MGLKIQEVENRCFTKKNYEESTIVEKTTNNKAEHIERGTKDTKKLNNILNAQIYFRCCRMKY